MYCDYKQFVDDEYFEISLCKIFFSKNENMLVVDFFLPHSDLKEYKWQNLGFFKIKISVLISFFL